MRISEDDIKAQEVKIDLLCLWVPLTGKSCNKQLKSSMHDPFVLNEYQILKKTPMKKKEKLPVILFLLVSLIILMVTGCKKEKDETTVTDIDGNVYNTVVIGSDTWMKENLRTTRFRDGSDIPLVTDDNQWKNLTSAGFCWWENNPSNKATLGGLYNGFAVKDSRGLCPDGWHVPTDNEWIDMEVALGLIQSEAYIVGDRGENENVGGHLKALTHWDPPNSGADNSSGFSAIAAGVRRAPLGDVVEFAYFNTWAGFYTSSTSKTGFHWVRYIGYNMKAVGRFEREMQYGYSIRCIKD